MTVDLQARMTEARANCEDLAAVLEAASVGPEVDAVLRLAAAKQLRTMGELGLMMAELLAEIGRAAGVP